MHTQTHLNRNGRIKTNGSVKNRQRSCTKVSGWQVVEISYEAWWFLSKAGQNVHVCRGTFAKRGDGDNEKFTPVHGLDETGFHNGLTEIDEASEIIVKTDFVPTKHHNSAQKIIIDVPLWKTVGVSDPGCDSSRQWVRTIYCHQGWPPTR